MEPEETTTPEASTTSHFMGASVAESVVATEDPQPESIEEQRRDLRQQDLVPPDKLAEEEVMIIGCGAIGRQVAWMLASLGVPKIYLVDHDHVEIVNLGPQAWAHDSVGHYKVDALESDISRLNPDIEITSYNTRWRRSMPRPHSTFCCVDSIKVRSNIWNTFLPYWHSKGDRQWFWVDGRMAGEVLRVLTCTNTDKDLHLNIIGYGNTLFSQEEAFQGACTTQSTIYSAALAAGLMVSQYTKWLRHAPMDNDLTFSILSGELSPTPPELRQPPPPPFGSSNFERDNNALPEFDSDGRVVRRLTRAIVECIEGFDDDGMAYDYDDAPVYDLNDNTVHEADVDAFYAGVTVAEHLGHGS